MPKQAAGKKTKLMPLYDRVIIRQDEASETYGGLIIIPDASKEKLQTGTVEAVGQGKISDLTNEVRPMLLAKGDRVMFGKYSGDEIEINGEKLLMMREDAVYGRLEE